MRVLRSLHELAEIPEPLFLAIGVFDGVHLGHRAVIQRALDDAQKAGGTAAVITFDPHPVRVLRPEKAPRLLTSTPHKIRLIRELGVSAMVIQKFDPAFAQTPADRFIRELAGSCRELREICVGNEWSFGKDRLGNLELLRILGEELGFEEVGVAVVEVDGQIVSSTMIRSAIERGDFATAAKSLGREYTVLGTVVEGDQLGRKLGFPTANLSAHNEQFPPNGVYAVEADLGEGRRGGVVNIGVRPTIHAAEGERVLELHLFDFHEKIYGADIEIFFRHYLRPEQKFAGLDELRAQIERDVSVARGVLSGT